MSPWLCSPTCCSSLAEYYRPSSVLRVRNSADSGISALVEDWDRLVAFGCFGEAAAVTSPGCPPAELGWPCGAVKSPLPWQRAGVTDGSISVWCNVLATQEMKI